MRGSRERNTNPFTKGSNNAGRFVINFVIKMWSNLGECGGMGNDRGKKTKPRKPLFFSDLRGVLLKAAVGFRPRNEGFAIRPLGPLGYAAKLFICSTLQL